VCLSVFECKFFIVLYCIVCSSITEQTKIRIHNAYIPPMMLHAFLDRSGTLLVQLLTNWSILATSGGSQIMQQKDEMVG